MDPDQLASEKPADLDRHCFQNKIYPCLALALISISQAYDFFRNYAPCFITDFQIKK